MLAVFKKELKGYFTGAIGYAFLFIYLAVAGILFASLTMFSMSSNVATFYSFMLVLSAVALPILTMKSFSEERKTKTEQLLLTAPISLFAMVIGKLLASYVIYAGCILLTSLYFLFLIPFTQLQVAVLIGNVLAMLMVGLVFISIGLFVSALTENQLAAAIGTMGIILAFLGIGLVSSLFPSDYFIRFILDGLSILNRFQSFVNGYFDFATVLYYLSCSAVFVWLTVRVFDRRRYS